MSAWQTLVSATVNPAVRQTFGESVTYTPQSTGVAESITAAFDIAMQVVEMQGTDQIISVAPVLDVVLSDLTVAPRGRPVSGSPDLCTVRGLSYAVIRVEPSGNGTLRCILARS